MNYPQITKLLRTFFSPERSEAQSKDNFVAIGRFDYGLPCEQDRGLRSHRPDVLRERGLAQPFE
jgi:hypothetical protein